MAIPPKSVKIDVKCDFENPDCKWSELEPLIDKELTAIMTEIKNKIISKVTPESGEGDVCKPFREFNQRTRECP